MNRFEERLNGHPAIAAVAVASAAPLSGLPPRHRLLLSDNPAADPAVAPELGIVNVTTGYFDALGVSMVRGRAFRDTDGAAEDPVVIVNQRFADTYFSAQDPLGRQIRLIETAAPDKTLPWLTIVGVSPSVRQAIVTEAIPVAYLPYRGETVAPLVVIARAVDAPAKLVPILREEMRALDSGIPIAAPQTAAQMLAVRFFTHNIASGIFIALGIVALLVTTGGLYVITAHAVTARTQEIGIRMAVGAPPGSISWLIGRRAIVLVGLGCLAGAAGAMAARNLMKIFVAESGLDDWRLIVTTAALLTVIGLMAAFVPARRAARLDPTVALRHE